MPLETLRPDNRTNISTVSVEAPDFDKSFGDNIEKEIEEGYKWEKMLLEQAIERNTNWDNFISMSVNMALLRPDQIEELDIGQEKLKRLKREILDLPDWFGADIEWDKFLKKVVLIKLIEKSKFNKEILTKIWESLKKELDVREGDVIDISIHLSILSSARMIFPEKAEELSKYDSNFNLLWQNGKYAAIDYLAKKKIIDSSEEDVSILNKTDQEKMLRFLRNIWNPESVDQFLRIALNMKIIAAEKIEITDDDIKIIMRDKSTDKGEVTPPMPDIKKY